MTNPFATLTLGDLTEDPLRPGIYVRKATPTSRTREPVQETVTPAKSLYWPYKSATEQRYANLLEALKFDKHIAQWWYEPCKGLYLAPKTSYTPDFLVQWVPGHPRTQLEFHEVKGAHLYEKDWIKAKQAAAHYACFRFILAQWEDGAWHYTDIPTH